MNLDKPGLSRDVTKQDDPSRLLTGECCHRETFWARTAWKGHQPQDRKGGWTHSLCQLQPSLFHLTFTPLLISDAMFAAQTFRIRKPQES